MSAIVTIALICICAKLWNELGQLRSRIVFLEASVDAVRAAGVVRDPGAPAHADRSTARTAPYAAARPPAIVVGETDPEAERTGDVRLDGSPILARLPNETVEAAGTVHAAPTAGRAAPTRTFHRAVEEPAPGRTFGLEDVFGRMLPIWAGGVTLAIAGLLIVKWSIDAGLLSPAIRVVLGALFGAGLVAGAEVALRRGISDDRIPQALSGAGVASLYGAVLAANLHYGLIGPVPALVMMVIVTAAAVALSFRFGAPSALLGLVGGLAAPALVGAGTPSVPLLSVYVGLMSAGVGLVARMQGRAWLGAFAAAGGMLWVLALLGISGDPVSALFLGSLAIGLGFALPVLLPAGDGTRMLRVVGAGVACLQVAGLVVIGGFGLVQWGMLFLATLAVLGLSEREQSMRDLAAPMLVLALVVAAAWSDATGAQLGLTLSVFGLVHAAHAFRHLLFPETARTVDAGRLVLLPIALTAVFAIHVPSMGDVAHAALFGGASILTALACVFVQRTVVATVGFAAQPLAVCLGAAGLWFVLPRESMPAVLAAAAIALAWTPRWMPGMVAATALSAAWTLEPLFAWLAGVIGSIAGQPFLTGALPDMIDVAWRMLPSIAIGAAIVLGRRGPRPVRVAGYALLGLAAVVLHVMWRGAWGIDTMEVFATRGMLDRTVLEALLAVAAVAAWRFDHRVAAGLGLAALAHFAWFTGLVHDPLWSAQEVGTLPLLNLVTVSYGVALGLLWAAGRIGLDATWERVRSVAQIILIVAFGFTELRQMVSGTLLQAAGVTVAEQISRSILAILLAVGFLVHGIFASRIEWRVGSLVLMLVAVAKVFLFDAAGLDGLARILSFAALGFSLIGVGWLYSRLLPGSPKTA